MTPPSKTVVSVLEDLFFTVKISDAAKRAGLQAIFCKTTDSTLERIREQPLLVLVDLNCPSVDPLDLVKRIKVGEFRHIPLIGYVSHVQGELKQRAQEAGYDSVLARSAFSTNIVPLLRRHAGLAT